jgi:2-keto-4-pentenoate hydratase/2-oxohepta-3-ene-1,7-dioic acid hydratase in catechol pathway
MKIICIGRNYVDHAKELNNPLPLEPVFFMKPDTALLKDNEPFYLPDFSNDIHHEIELVVKISKAGKHIQQEFAKNYYEQVTVGIDFTARDLQQQCKEKGLPWEKAKAFDGSAPVGTFIAINSNEVNELPFYLEINGEKKQQGNTADMLFSVDSIISYVSKFVTLKTGDLIFTGTPAGVGPVKIGDRLKGFLSNQPLIEFEIK